MKATAKIISALTAVALLATMTACDESAGGGASTSGLPSQAASPTSATTSGVPSTLNDEVKEVIAGIEIEGAEKLENPTVKWLSFWDINPINGKAVPVQLEMFQNVYGGEIEYIQTTWEDKFNKLGTLIAAGDSPDMFPGADMDSFPKGAAMKTFQPFDDYIDFDSELWAPMKDNIDKFEYQGGHYVAVTGTDAGVVMIYNQKTIDNNGLEDPRELLAAGNWTWDTFNTMMDQFCDREQGKFALDGWWFEHAFCATTGVPLVEMVDGLAVQNLNDGLLEKAQFAMEEMRINDYPYPKWENGWQINPSNIADGKTLFYPCGIWALYEADLTDYGNTEDIAFVPMPRCPYADEYYLPSSIDAYMMCKDAPNPEGVAAYLNCCMIARDDPAAKEISKNQLFEDYGWTEEMYQMLQDVQELTEANPVLDMYGGVSSAASDLLNNPIKDSFNNATSWTQTRESIIPSVQAEIDAVNAKLSN